MTTQIIQKYFKDDNETKLYLYPPVLYRQVAMRMTYDESLNIFTCENDDLKEMNQISMNKAYTKECLKEFKKKYNQYKKIFHSINIFKKIIKNKLPIEIVLEVIKYI